MAEELTGTAQSLAALAVEKGLIPAPGRDRLLAELRQLTQAKTPTSFARLLIRSGVPAPTVQGLLATGSGYPAVLCEGCGLAIPQGMLPERKEYPCSRCGTMVLGFAAFLRTPPPRDKGDDENTEEIPALPARPPARSTPLRAAQRLPAVQVTDRFDQVLTPPGGQGAATPPAPAEGEEDLGGRTMTFSDVLPTRGAAPAPPAPLPLPPPPPPVPPASGGGGLEEGQTTIQFDNVFVLPSAPRPLSESQVRDEMVTLLAPAAAYGLGPHLLGGSQEGPGFDAEAMTIPTGRSAADVRAAEAAARGPRPAPQPGLGEHTMVVGPPPGGAEPVAVGPPPRPVVEPTMIAPPPPGALDQTLAAPPPPGVMDATLPPGLDPGAMTMAPSYAESPTVPPDRIYAQEGPRMKELAAAAQRQRQAAAPRIWPWVLALVLLLGVAATGVFLLLWNP